MAPQTPRPMRPKKSARVLAPGSRRRARLREAQIDGRSRYGNACVVVMVAPSMRSEDLIDLLQPAAAGQAQEDVGERLGRVIVAACATGGGQRAQLGDGAV